MVRIGAHDREGDPLTVAHATGADVIQFFLGDTQGWGAPTFPGGDPAALTRGGPSRSLATIWWAGRAT